MIDFFSHELSSRAILVPLAVIVCLATTYCLPASTVVAQEIRASDELAKESTWQPTTQARLQESFKTWATDASLGAATSDKIHSLVDKTFVRQAEGNGKTLLDLVIDGLAIGREDVGAFKKSLATQRMNSQPPDFTSLIENDQENEFLRKHVRLYLGRWLAQNEFYDESLACLENVKVEEVLDPATLLFYRGLMEHQLLQKEACIKTIERLLENEAGLPKRYAVLARLVLADIEPLKKDSLDEISRLMGDVGRRTGLHRSGKLVIEQEEQVIKKLDRLIEEMEAAQKQQAAANTVVPSNPMQDSANAGGQGSGEVKSKRQQDGGDWGDLPPAERAAALAEMAKDMPPHYRAVIEEYFRQLAREGDE